MGSEGDLLGVFPRDSAWGNRIVFDDYEERRVYGWWSGENGRLAEEGDRFGYQMESGRVAIFELKNVENQDDPRDMFFAEAEDIGYKDVEA